MPVVRPAPRTGWGTWTLNRENWTLSSSAWPYYEIDLERMGTPAAMLDWIFQVYTLGFMEKEPRHFYDLIRALDDIFYPQATLVHNNPPITNVGRFLATKYRART